MARVLGALFSESASGKFGRLLVFRRGRNFTNVSIFRPARKSNTNKQIILRKVYGLILADIRIMNDDLKKEYRKKAYGLNMDGNNVFYKEVFPWVYDSRCGDTRCGFGTCKS